MRNNMIMDRFSSEQWEPLVRALRVELQEYGGLISLLDEQRHGILGRNTDGLLERSSEINNQLESVRKLRTDREVLTHSLVRDFDLEEEGSLSEMVPYVPEPVQPLLQELIDRINDLLGKIQRKAGQNRMLLLRAHEITEQIMRSLQPHDVTKTYNRMGKITLKAPSRGGNIEFSA